MTRRPSSTEYDAFYASYVASVPEGDVLDILATEGRRAGTLFESIPPEKKSFRYAPGKWSVREVIGHVIDTERIFSFRMLWMSRGDLTPLPGMDQDTFVAGAEFDSRGLASLAREFKTLRESNIVLGRSFSEEVLNRRGFASGLEFSVRALMYIMAGHAIHHVRVLEDRYL